jgi:hypothetical protein
MELPKRMGDGTSTGYWVPSGSLGATALPSSCSSGDDQSRVDDCWSAASFSDTPVLAGAKAAGAVAKDCTCTAKHQRKSDINRIIIVIVVVKQELERVE